MLITSAIVPGPPALVAELMGSAAHELDDLRDAADRAVSGVLAALVERSARAPKRGASGVGAGAGDGSGSGARQGAGPGEGAAQLVVVGPGEPAEFSAAGPVSFASFGRDVTLPALVAGRLVDDELPTPILVARYLASRDIAAHPGHAGLWASARWVTTSGGDATALGERLAATGTAVGLILVADGATCHGAKAPRAQDDRAPAYDDGVCAALASGQASRLAQIDAVLGEELGANGYEVWPVLVAATAAAVGSGAGGDRQAVGEVLWAGAPYGVGWAVATWHAP